MNADHETGNPKDLDWRKSSYSGSHGGDCVEVAAAPTVMHVRDSKLPDLASLAFPAAHWAALTNSVRHNG